MKNQISVYNEGQLVIFSGMRFNKWNKPSTGTLAVVSIPAPTPEGRIEVMFLDDSQHDWVRLDELSPWQSKIGPINPEVYNEITRSFRITLNQYSELPEAILFLVTELGLRLNHLCNIDEQKFYADCGLSEQVDRWNSA